MTWLDYQTRYGPDLWGACRKLRQAHIPTIPTEWDELDAQDAYRVLDLGEAPDVVRRGRFLRKYGVSA